MSGTHIDLVNLWKLNAAISTAVKRHLARVPRTFYGTVTSTSPLTVTLDQDSVAQPAAQHRGYTPAVGDRVVCKLVGRELIVEDAVIASGA